MLTKCYVGDEVGTLDIQVWAGVEQIEKRPDFRSTTLGLLIPDRVQFRAVTANLKEGGSKFNKTL